MSDNEQNGINRRGFLGGLLGVVVAHTVADGSQQVARTDNQGPKVVDSNYVLPSKDSNSSFIVCSGEFGSDWKPRDGYQVPEDWEED